MKTRTKPARLALVVFLFAGMAVVLVIQQRAFIRVREQNRLLQQQVNGLRAQANQLTDEKEGLSKLVAVDDAKAGAPLAGEQFSELLRLRGEVGRLRLDERASEQARRDEMQAAQAKLAGAESELAQLTKLRTENLVSLAEVERARFALELLKAQAKGDTTEAARLRLEQAQTELARAAELRNQSLISQAEYEEALRKVESLRGGAE